MCALCVLTACRADVVDDRSRQPMKLKIPMGMEQKFVPKVQHPDAVLTGGSYEQRLQYYPIVRFLGQRVSVAYFCEFSKKEYNILLLWLIYRL